MITEAEKQKRKTFIGGSDIASIFGIGDYACPRRTYYSKVGTKEDFDLSLDPKIAQGSWLEAPVADLYAFKTGRSLRPLEQSVSKEWPHSGASPDRLIEGIPEHKNGAPGALEIKVTSNGFQFANNGLPDSYTLQLQYTLAVLGLEWGAFAIYVTEGKYRHELWHWDIEHDEALTAPLFQKADWFWTAHVIPRIAPKPLAEGSAPCKRCQYVKTCRLKIEF